MFEIKKLEGRFRADTYEQALKAVKVTKIQEFIVLAIFILIVTPAELGLVIQQIYDEKVIFRHPGIFDGIIIVRSIAKTLIDSFMFYSFMRAFVILVEKKKEFLIDRYGPIEGQLTTYNRFIITSTYVLFGLNAV